MMIKCVLTPPNVCTGMFFFRSHIGLGFKAVDLYRRYRTNLVRGKEIWYTYITNLNRIHLQ